jgi:peptidoglycan/xylan/chitin deacetylase (PgdA/CDA1 family)
MTTGRTLLLSSALVTCALATVGILSPAFPLWPIAAALALDLAIVLAGVMIPGLALFAPVVCHVGRRRQQIALTFDDGPSPRSTPKLLAELARHQARATFFVLGAKAERFPEILRAIHAAGHEIGVHGQTHDRLLSLRHPRKIVADLERAQSIVAAATGHPARLFRPPVGHVSPRTAVAARRLGLTLVGWNVRARDGLAGARADAVARRVVSRLRPGAIVLLHDASERDQFEPASVAAIGPILTALSERGLACVTVSEGLSGGGMP